jgi:hypothetical protein
MPKSRKRKIRRKSGQPRRQRIATLRPGQDLSHLLTEEDHELMRAEIDAGARGDALAALNFHEAGLQVEGSLRRYQLRELVILGDDAPPWAYSRWCLDVAYHWMLLEQDPRVDDAVRQLMLCTHVDAAMATLDDPVAFAELGTRIAAGDRLCQQLALYEYGGLWDFLDVKAESGLIDRCDQILAWSEQPMNGYVIKDARGPLLHAVDLRTGGEVDVLNIGALTDLDRGAPVIGRLGPISSDPGLMFQGRPIAVDLTTAQGVAESSGPQDDWPRWVPAVADGAHDGRLPHAFSCDRPTLYCSDIAAIDEGVDSDDLDAPGRLTELRATGLDDIVANGVMVAEVALIAVEVSGPDAVSAVGPHLASVIVEPRVLEALRVHCTGPEHEHHWDILAAGTVEPVRSRCTELARMCREAA